MVCEYAFAKYNIFKNDPTHHGRYCTNRDDLVEHMYHFNTAWLETNVLLGKSA